MNPLALGLGRLVASLEQVGIPYFVGGSLASSAHGLARSTLDVDLVIQITQPQCLLLAGDLGKEWYADTELMRDALENGRAFNLVHLPTGYKFDIFPANTEFHRSQLTRAKNRRVPGAESVTCKVATAEDILLAKLRWYRDGGEISDRQWSDIGGILEVNSNLDDTYLDHWAARLGVSDLLARARME